MAGKSSPSVARPGIPVGIWTLGFVSMLMDISSEMIHALLPVYMVTVLGTSTLAVGIIEGIAEATASIAPLQARCVRGSDTHNYHSELKAPTLPPDPTAESGRVAPAQIAWPEFACGEPHSPVPTQ